ncbi:MAG: T9SS type A sorting domain-containing protein, partial [Bacteroidota bacterium]
DHSGQSVFSPKGKKYARYSSLTGIFIYDFDRCEGLLSNPLLIDGRDINSFTYGAAISPNSRFLYTTQNTKVFQFDLTADDIEASEVQIAEYDDYANPNPTYFGFLQLAPDNKIYGTGSQLFPFLHVIHQPNEKGLACQFEQRGLTLPTDNDASLPNFPHFRPDNANDHCRQLPELILDASPACIGETFKVTLISQYLDRTLSLDAKIIWDASVLQLDEATLLIQQEGWNIDSTDPVQGELLISWQDDSGQGISLPDYEDILELQFLVIGGDGDQANLRFAEMPQIEQLVNGQATEEDILLVEPPLFLDALNLAQQEVSPVQEENDGTISIQVQGGTPPYFYSWNTNDSLPTLSELSAGDYYCTITDYGGCILEIGPITVDQIVGLEETYLVAGIQVFPNPSDGHLSINFPTKQTGRLLIRDMQGQTIRSQSFSQRQELQLTEQLPAGLYIATIQRENQASQSVKLLISH